jgi:hypothetical protein
MVGGAHPTARFALSKNERAQLAQLGSVRLPAPSSNVSAFGTCTLAYYVAENKMQIDFAANAKKKKRVRARAGKRLKSGHRMW